MAESSGTQPAQPSTAAANLARAVVRASAPSTGSTTRLGRNSAAVWQALQPIDAPPMTVSVNLSGRQLTTPGFAVEVGAAIARSGADASHLCFEVTENTLLDAAGSGVATLERLKELGVRLAIDDFGTGYSSLGHLKRFPIDLLKVDRSFVCDIADDDEDASIVAAVVGLARSLGMGVLAEGVESARQAEVLADLGCELAQGFHFARPAPAESVTDLLRRWTAGVGAERPG